MEKVYSEQRAFRAARPATLEVALIDQLARLYPGEFERSEASAWEATREKFYWMNDGDPRYQWEKPVIFEQYKLELKRAAGRAIGEAFGTTFRGIAAVFGGISEGFQSAPTPDPAQAMRDKRKKPDDLIERLLVKSKPDLWAEAKSKQLVGFKGDSYTKYTKRQLAVLLASRLATEVED